MAKTAPRTVATQRYLSENAKEWTRRERKWHRRLEWERAWKWIGAGAPAVIAAVGGLIVHFVGHQTLVLAVTPVLLSLLGLRAVVAANRISEGKYDTVWATSDRIAKAYQAILARVDDGEDPRRLRRLADALEAEGRVGIPDSLKAVLLSDRGDDLKDS